jgi:peroxiredoxin
LVQLAQWQERFAQIGVQVGAMTYDSLAVLKAFHTEQGLNYPLLRDIERKHVDAYGVRNLEYTEGMGFGIPHPGILYIAHDGVVTLKFAVAGYKQRPPLEDVYQAILALDSEADPE